MLCPRCQSQNKPGQHTCWNCLAPLDGALAQRFAQRPPEVSSNGATGPKKEGAGFWIAMIALAFLLLVASMVGFWMFSQSVTGSLPDAAKSLMSSGSSSSSSSTTTTSTGGETSGGTPAGAATAGASTAGSSSSSSSSSDSGSSTGGIGGRNKDMKDLEGS